MTSSKEFADRVFDRMEMISNPLERRGILEYEVSGHTGALRAENVKLKQFVTTIANTPEPKDAAETRSMLMLAIGMALKLRDEWEAKTHQAGDSRE